MWRRIAARVLPAATVADIGRVSWRIIDPALPAASGVTTVGFSIPVARQLLNDSDPGRWHGSRWTWARWPHSSITDLILADLGRAFARIASEGTA